MSRVAGVGRQPRAPKSSKLIQFGPLLRSRRRCAVSVKVGLDVAQSHVEGNRSVAGATATPPERSPSCRPTRESGATGTALAEHLDGNEMGGPHRPPRPTRRCNFRDGQSERAQALSVEHAVFRLASISKHFVVPERPHAVDRKNDTKFSSQGRHKSVDESVSRSFDGSTSPVRRTTSLTPRVASHPSHPE
jgi:hypothetical protein